MQLLAISLLFALHAAAGPFPLARRDAVQPLLTDILSVDLSLGSPAGQIPIAGGVKVVEPIYNGTVSGVFNGTIAGGLAYPNIVSMGQVQIPYINVYGTTADGRAFFISETGIGSPSNQYTLLTLSLNETASGTNYSSSFLLGHIQPSADRTTVHVDVFTVT